jgi:hypothetical protein
MLPPFIIDQIRRREEEELRRQQEQQRIWSCLSMHIRPVGASATRTRTTPIERDHPGLG